MIKLIIQPRNNPINKGYWKFNSSLLEDEVYSQAIINEIQKITKDRQFTTQRDKWEFFKFKARQISITHSKRLSKDGKQKEMEIIREINSICCKSLLSEGEKQRLSLLQTSLDNMYVSKAKGAFIRSRAKWVEEGEKSSAYFCRLEKRRQEKNAVNKLVINGRESTNTEEIKREIFQFYSGLYSSSYSSQDADCFFNYIKDLTPKVDENFKQVCEAEITLEEAEKAMRSLALDKSPGSDGLTINFYRHFWDHLKEQFLLVIKEISELNILPTTMKQGVITLIPKPGKDARLIDNLRPISLLNSDYKILTNIYASRLKTGLNQIISDTQSGFLKGRSIHNNIRLVLDLIDYNQLIEDDGFILFLDFFKAFDTVEHKFMFQTLEIFGFGPNFISFVQTIYNDTNSVVILPNGISPRFLINKGIKQGCPISPLLFITATEMLSILIKNSGFSKLSVLGEQLAITQLADDTAIFMKDSHQIPDIIQTVDFFSKASGLKLNLSKCELLPVHHSDQSVLHNIPVRTVVKYLGVHISKDSKTMEEMNLWKTLEKCKVNLNMWSQRDISILGRVFLTKLECLSRFIYPAYSLPIPKSARKAINQANFNFIWKNKTHYIKKGTIIQDYSAGGLKAIDFESLDGMIKINWLRSFLQNERNMWFHIPSNIFSHLGGIELLLKCDFDYRKLPIKLSTYHQQVLLYWKLIYKHNFSPHNTPIWNCRYVLCRNKSIFYKNWFDNGIWSLLHIMNDNGNIISFETFSSKFKLNDRKQYNNVIKAIPQTLIQMSSSLVQNVQVQLPSLLFDGRPVNSKLPNSFIRSLFVRELFPTSDKNHSMSQHYTGEEISKLRSQFIKYPIFPKYKEIHFKIMNAVYPCKELLHIRFGFPENNCSFCDTNIETLDHLFFECMYVYSFWEDFFFWCSSKFPFPISIHLQKHSILFGVVSGDNLFDLTFNTLLISGKFFIHKCRFLKNKPLFNTFFKEISLYFKSLTLMKNKNAIKLCIFIEDHKLYHNP
uniref:Reverse transcriptase domain-containing protein n=1 Tax=Oryzias latipes TaxID=8090 RepID=A0A3B3H9P1_ORYLA